MAARTQALVLTCRPSVGGACEDKRDKNTLSHDFPGKQARNRLDVERRRRSGANFLLRYLRFSLRGLVGGLIGGARVSEFTVKHCLTGFRLSHQDRKCSSRPLLVFLCSLGEPCSGHLVGGVWHLFDPVPCGRLGTIPGRPHDVRLTWRQGKRGRPRLRWTCSATPRCLYRNPVLYICSGFSIARGGAPRGRASITRRGVWLRRRRTRKSFSTAARSR